MNAIDLAVTIYDNIEITRPALKKLAKSLNDPSASDLDIFRELLEIRSLTQETIKPLENIHDLFNLTFTDFMTEGLDEKHKKDFAKLVTDFEQHLSLILSIVDRKALIALRQSVNISEENKEDEANGDNVISLDSEGRIVYCTDLCVEEDYCDSCSYLRFLDAPDPLDPFRDSDQQPYCYYAKKNIGNSVTVLHLEKTWVPDWCPKKTNN